MSQIRSFSITFPNAIGPQKITFISGMLVECQVTLELKELMQLRGINLKLKGLAEIYSHDGRIRRYSFQKYFDEQFLLFGSTPQEGQQLKELAAGVHNFPFKFQLPSALPSSFENPFGHVSYTATATIDRPRKFDYTTESIMIVIGAVDLKKVPDSSKSRHTTNSKNICCWCCQSGPIEATFHIEKFGYVLGEDIKLFAEISNNSKRKIKKSFVDLIQVITLRHVSSSQAMTFTKVVARVIRPGFGPGKDDAWSGEQLTAPYVLPSTHGSCQIIDVSYILQLSIAPAGPALNLTLPIAIVLGTSPVDA
ncbi:hypothetical protein Btru_065543 [Bulinus truncatus]|nr:hypothetical protein Btru_065543 [Bulinus truncatus]